MSMLPVNNQGAEQPLDKLTPEQELKMKEYAQKLHKKYPRKDFGWIMKKVANHFKVALVDDKGRRLNPGSKQKIYIGTKRHS